MKKTTAQLIIGLPIGYGLGLASGTALAIILPDTFNPVQKILASVSVSLTTSYVANKVTSAFVDDIYEVIESAKPESKKATNKVS